mmetsp:Transcript_6902/g.15246  ORF Transcript_6902/g.15246 Transcript_6902/m.15246 type:complete len:349 (+) Transcript_6902:3150-4196(+)
MEHSALTNATMASLSSFPLRRNTILSSWLSQLLTTSGWMLVLSSLRPNAEAVPPMCTFLMLISFIARLSMERTSVVSESLISRLAFSTMFLIPPRSGGLNSTASVGMPLAICCSSSQREMQRSTSTHLSCTWSPTASATLSRYLKASAFFCFMVAGLCRCVKLQMLLMKMSRRLVMPVSAVRQQLAAKPASVSLMSRASTYSSNSTERAPSSGAQITSIMGLTASASVTVTAVELLAFSCRKSSVCLMASSLGSLDTCCLVAPMRERMVLKMLRAWLAPSLPACAPAPSRSSFILISLLMMRSYSAPMNSSGRSCPSLMPRLFFRKPSLLIFFLTWGLCASVLSMMTE